MKNDREYRSLQMNVRSAEGEYIVEGYASTFEPYFMYSAKGVNWYEQIGRNAFDDADFSDCVFRVDHTGPVYARTSAGTVEFNIDDGGLHTVTDLGRTAKGRSLHEDIAAGNYPQMSFAFTIAEEHTDRKNHTRIIDRIAKVFDIAAVTWPANPTTSLSARSLELFDGEIESEIAERHEEERKQKALERIRKATKGDTNED